LWIPLIQGDVDGNKIKCKTRTDQIMHTDCRSIRGSEQGGQVPRGQGQGTGTKGSALRLGNKGEEGCTATHVCPTRPRLYRHGADEGSRLGGWG